MVYCGKPSKGCAPCRAKRTKCDLGFPTCGQCVRTGRFCTGYRQEAYVEFRDKNREVAIKQSRMNARMRLPAASTESLIIDSALMPISEWSPEAQDIYASGITSPIPLGLFPCPDDGVACFFFKDYVLTEETIPPRGLFSELPGLYNKADRDSALSKIITACGLASLSTTLKQPQVMLKANAKYAEALSAINSALRDPVLAKDDYTLLVIILLGLYEEGNTTSTSIEPWTHHVHGSLALLDYRGEQQLQSPLGLRMIQAIRSSTGVNCLVRRVCVPSTILKWTKLAREYETQDEVMDSELSELIAKYCNLQATINQCDEYIDPVKVVEYASNIDAELIAWATKWHSGDLYDTILASPSLDILSDYWHSYSDIMITCVWNNYRSIRILLHQIITEQLSRIESSFPTDSILQYSSTIQRQIEASKKEIIELSHEICATIPYYMYHSYYNDRAGWDSAYHPKNTARTKLVIWPLYVAGQSECVSDSMRFWTAYQLEKIGVSMGIGKCVALAQLLRMKLRHAPKKWREIGMDE